jgi:heme-degrading monooxygenase HmoA
MFIIVWEYQVRADSNAEFEEVYGENGAWVELFQEESGYADTELLQDEQDAQRYLTIDRWDSQQAYERFYRERRDKYENLDARCRELTENESLLGKWHTRDHETR